MEILRDYLIFLLLAVVLRFGVTITFRLFRNKNNYKPYKKKFTNYEKERY